MSSNLPILEFDPKPEAKIEPSREIKPQDAPEHCVICFFEEGLAKIVMEAAGLMAVAEYRGVILGQVVYGGDDLSGIEWDSRGWQSRQEVRENLFWLAAEACLGL
jgi:hypothetical protein